MRLLKSRQRRRFRRPVRLLQQLEDRIVLDATINPTVQDQPAANPEPSPDATSDQFSASAAPSADGAPPPALAKVPDNFIQVFSQPLNEVLISNSPADIADGSPESQADAGGAAKLLVISSSVNGADELAAAAQPGVITVTYNGSNDTPAMILSSIEAALAGQKGRQHRVRDS